MQTSMLPLQTGADLQISGGSIYPSPYALQAIAEIATALYVANLLATQYPLL